MVPVRLSSVLLGLILSVSGAPALVAQSTDQEGRTGGSTRYMAGWTVDLGTPEPLEGGLYLAAPGEGRTSYFIAPAGIIGDLSDRVVLVFEKKSWGGTYYRDGDTWRGDVVLYNGAMTAAYTIEQDHSRTWRRFIVPLSDHRWTLSGGASSLMHVLGNVTRLEIRAEYGAGDDYSILRNVEFR